MLALGLPQPQLSEQQRWAMQNAARQAWMRSQFQAATRGMNPLSPGSLMGSGGGMTGSAASLRRATEQSAPATGLSAALGKYALGPAGAGLAFYGATQQGRGVKDLARMAAQLPQQAQESAWKDVGRATLDQASSGALQHGASGASAGAFLGPVGAGVGAGLGAMTGYLAAMRRGMQTSQGRQAVLAAMTPRGGQNWGRFAAHSPEASMAFARGNVGGAASGGLLSYGHKKLAKKLLG